MVKRFCFFRLLLMLVIVCLMLMFVNIIGSLEMRGEVFRLPNYCKCDVV